MTRFHVGHWLLLGVRANDLVRLVIGFCLRGHGHGYGWGHGMGSTGLKKVQFKRISLHTSLVVGFSY